MLDYQTLDTIADSYTPLLALLCLGFLAKSAYQKDFSNVKVQGLFIIYALVVSYGIMVWDNQFNVWPALGLDYSTHTAVAFSLVASLCLMFKPFVKWYMTSLFSSLLMYGALMKYQNYHSYTDMLSTALVVAIFLAPFAVRIIKNPLKPSSKMVVS
ncbi:MAG: hypothetical protein V7785_09890 [Bermanella sp.]